MIRRVLALALALVLTLTVVGHMPGFDGMATAQTLPSLSQSAADAAVVPSGDASVRAVVYDANRCKASRHGLTGPCAFDAVPPPAAAESPPDLLAARLSTTEAQPERSWPSPLLRPPNSLF